MIGRPARSWSLEASENSTRRNKTLIDAANPSKTSARSSFHGAFNGATGGIIAPDEVCVSGHTDRAAAYYHPDGEHAQQSQSGQRWNKLTPERGRERTTACPSIVATPGGRGGYGTDLQGTSRRKSTHSPALAYDHFFN
ncbi:hypothetical protein THAOC_01071, partial [Thalassiosira oceanica]